MVAMLAGRLEIYTLLLVVRIFGRGRDEARAGAVKYA